MFVPVVFTLALLLLIPRTRRFITGLPLQSLTYIHTLRVLVEIVLLWLFMERMVPQIMTFEGRNFNILAGLTAPTVAYWGIGKQRMGRTGLLIWNIVCLGLLVNIVSIAILSAPFTFQKFGFEQPNIAILIFPYVLLPAIIVPIVLFSHVASILRLVNEKT